MNALFIFGAITAIGTAILTTAAVAKLLVSPITTAITDLKDAVGVLGQRLEESDTEHHKDIKELWRYLAGRSE